MSEQKRDQSFADLNTALAAWDWSRAEKAARDLDALDETPEGMSVVETLGVAREWVETASADSGSLLPEECEQWNPYKPAYVAYTPQGKIVWRCTHTNAEGNGPHEIEVSS